MNKFLKKSANFCHHFNFLIRTFPAGVLDIFGLLFAPGVDVGERKPLVGTRDGIPRNGVVSVIFLGIPRVRNGIIGADDFFSDCASEDFCNNSVRNAALFGFRFSVKCFVDAGCCPTLNKNQNKIDDSIS